LRIAAILFQGVLAGLHGALKRLFVAANTGEEIVADFVVETLRNRDSGQQTSDNQNESACSHGSRIGVLWSVFVGQAMNGRDFG
jgi:hypothetical protein